MSKSVRSNFSDDSFDKIFDIDKITKSITKSVEKNTFIKLRMSDLECSE